eukprot:91111-Chlamydomonas_euryale.AAC.4
MEMPAGAFAVAFWSRDAAGNPGLGLLAAERKVHGSLARAGKVRGQTPKVPPQEKKKKPTGRAMKRIKYTRRFVNVGE